MRYKLAEEGSRNCLGRCISLKDMVYARRRTVKHLKMNVGISAPPHIDNIIGRDNLYSYMDVSEAGRRGALATNKLLTKEGRSRAAKKGWKNRKKKKL